MEAIISLINEAYDDINQFTDTPYADLFFEEADAIENDNLAKRAMSKLKEAFQRLIEMVKDLIDNIKEFFAERFLTKEEKKAYADFKRMVRSDPELAKTKVTVEDWKEYEKCYEEALKELDKVNASGKLDNEIANQILENLQTKLRDVGEKFKAAATRGGYSYTLDAALDMADSCQAVAMGMDAALKLELADLKKAEESLGEERIEKFKKDMDAAARNSLFHRFKVTILRRKSKNINAFLKKEINKFLAFTNVKLGKDGIERKGSKVVDTSSVLKGVVTNADTINDAAGYPDGAKDVAKTVAKTALQVKKLEHSAKKTKKKADKVIGQAGKFFNVK